MLTEVNRHKWVLAYLCRTINAPVLNIFLGWPLQLLGLLIAPYLAVSSRKTSKRSLWTSQRRIVLPS